MFVYLYILSINLSYLLLLLGVLLFLGVLLHHLLVAR
jgi:hypothetical protein